ncbi:MAG: phosphatidate cytidylyltransferase [Phycisphaerae bacterium]
MKKRIVFGAVMIVFVAVLFALDGYLFSSIGPRRGLPVTVLIAALAGLALVEVAYLVKAAGGKVLLVSGLAGTLAVCTQPYWWPLTGGGPTSAMPLMGLVIMAVFAEQIVRFQLEQALWRIAATLLAVAYLGICGSVVLAIRTDIGLAQLLMFLAVVKLTDIGAYFTGSAIGRHKMIPWLSPGKSWEGLVGGVAVAAAVGAILAAVVGSLGMTARQGASFGVVIGLAGQFADLCESLLKRSAGLKDSGAAVPEFGGVLDILDSPLLASPLAYFILRHFAA